MGRRRVPFFFIIGPYDFFPAKIKITSTARRNDVKYTMNRKRASDFAPELAAPPHPLTAASYPRRKRKRFNYLKMGSLTSASLSQNFGSFSATLQIAHPGLRINSVGFIFQQLHAYPRIIVVAAAQIFNPFFEEKKGRGGNSNT